MFLKENLTVENGRNRITFKVTPGISRLRGGGIIKIPRLETSEPTLRGFLCDVNGNVSCGRLLRRLLQKFTYKKHINVCFEISLSH